MVPMRWNSLFRRAWKLGLLTGGLGLSVLTGETLPEGFVDVSEVVPSALLDLRYGTGDNFVGRVVDGYESPRAVLSVAAAKALKVAQQKLRPLGYRLKIYDAYRPQRAVVHFVKWAKDLSDTKTKGEYYPEVPKEELFLRGYIALESGHSRGSTVDVTLVRRSKEGQWQEVDMGSRYDFFGPISWPSAKGISAKAAEMRQLLRVIMLESGFDPYEQEWWHFTLRDEPYPETYFDFPF